MASLPAISAFYKTYIEPLAGAISKGETAGFTQGTPDRLSNPRLQSSALQAGTKSTGNKKTRIDSSPGGGNENGPTGGDGPPGGDTGQP